MQRETHLRIDQHDALEGCQDVVQLGGIGLQELTTGRDIEEQVAHSKRAAYRTGARLLTLHPRCREGQTGAYLIVLPTSAQLYLCHGGNRGQRFTTEAHGMQREQVVGFPDFRRGMTLESQTGIGHRHATAIVNHLDGRTAGIDHQHIDDMCSGINSILYQLLDHGSRTLYHLTSSYLVGHTVG